MKKLISLCTFAVMVLCIAFLFASCSKADKNYGVKPDMQETIDSSSTDSTPIPDYEYPKIKSDDTVMPKFFDISLFDEENYSNIYLGEDFIIDAVYDGQTISLPLSYPEFKKLDWKIAEGQEYDFDSLVLAGKTIPLTLETKSGKLLTASFFNMDNSSVTLKECSIVKIKIAKNFLLDEEGCKAYGKFNINGITNNLVLTDVVDFLGVPSHFYREDNNNYYLEYFISKADRRNGITVYVDIDNDVITAIEFSMYN